MENKILYDKTVEKLLKYSSIICPSDEEHFIEFSKEDYINANDGKIIAIDTGDGYLSAIISKNFGFINISVPFSQLNNSEQIRIGEILDKYISEYEENVKEKNTLYKIITSNSYMDKDQDKIICICDKDHLKECLKEFLKDQECSDDAVELMINNLMVDEFLPSLYFWTNEEGDDLDYETECSPDLTLRFEKLILNEVDLGYDY